MSAIMGISGAAYGAQVRAAVAPDRATAEPARTAPEQSQDMTEQAKRAIIGSVFKIDPSTDLRSMFGDIQFSEGDIAQTAAFLRGLESVRPADPPADGPRLDIRA